MNEESLKEKINSLEELNKGLEKTIEGAKNQIDINRNRIEQLQKQLSIEKFTESLKTYLMRCQFVPVAMDIIVKGEKEQIVLNVHPKN